MSKATRKLRLVGEAPSQAAEVATGDRVGTVCGLAYSLPGGDESVQKCNTGGNGAGTMAQGEAVEKTVQMVLDLPEGRDWEWLPDCNILVLSARLDEAGRQRAISDLQATWRRQFIKAVPEAAECPYVA